MSPFQPFQKQDDKSAHKPFGKRASKKGGKKKQHPNEELVKQYLKKR